MSKKAKIPTPKRTYLSGHDQLCAMIISAIDGCDEYDAGKMQRYRDRAIQILRSPHAFDEGLTTLSVTDIIVSDALRQDRSATTNQREYHEMVAKIFDGDERETVSASALQLRGMSYHAMSEAVCYGVALCFELLNGGAK